MGVGGGGRDVAIELHRIEVTLEEWTRGRMGVGGGGARCSNRATSHLTDAERDEIENRGGLRVRVSITLVRIAKGGTMRSEYRIAPEGKKTTF